MLDDWNPWVTLALKDIEFEGELLFCTSYMNYGFGYDIWISGSVKAMTKLLQNLSKNLGIGPFKLKFHNYKVYFSKKD